MAVKLMIQSFKELSLKFSKVESFVTGTLEKIKVVMIYSNPLIDEDEKWKCTFVEDNKVKTGCYTYNGKKLAYSGRPETKRNITKSYFLLANEKC